MVEYLQPFSLIFLAAQLSDGISNEIVLYPVLSPTGQLLSAFTLENSSQIFAIDVRFASPRTAGNYIIRKCAKLFTIAKIRRFIFMQHFVEMIL